eukprot:g17383.t1
MEGPSESEGAILKPGALINKVLKKEPTKARCPNGIREADKEGALPLHWAAEHNAPKEVVELLLKAYPEAVVKRDARGSVAAQLARNASEAEAQPRSMSEDLVSSLRDACLGPFDFAWLLERVADFGQEHPTWHGSEHKIDWKQGSPPAPIQLLVPEMILFHADKPHCLFFTDCAGFLRASVRALKQPHVVYHCMEQILKQRKDLNSSV